MSHFDSRFFPAFLVALLLGLTVGLTINLAPQAVAAGPASPSATPTPKPTPKPTPTLPQLSGPACDVNACTAACQTNNPEHGLKENCAPSCTTLIQNRKRNKQCKQ